MVLLVPSEVFASILLSKVIVKGGPMTSTPPSNTKRGVKPQYI